MPTSAGADVAGGVPVTWRLVGGNNHELGRAASPFPDLAACRGAVALLRTGASALNGVLSMSGPRGMWLWQASLAGVPAAVSPRCYRRQREALYNLEHFLAALPVADLPGGMSTRPRLRRLHLSDTSDEADAQEGLAPKTRIAAAGGR
ncbi:hypothetical protein AB0M28_36345 [Streptomyces sp. NPDC051940]|uniref:hypothetical protein n=1 Tax=Streptomyces sp. NPDC051940 TaxID=3155675 RepID=UPI00343A1B32